jgi:hypothetical protein
VTGWSLVQVCPAECGVSEYDCEASKERRPWLIRDHRAIKKLPKPKFTILLNSVCLNNFRIIDEVARILLAPHKFLRRPYYYWLQVTEIQADPRIRGLPRPEQKLENYRNKRFISFKTRPKRERAVTWRNPAAQTRPLIDSSSFVPVPALPRKLATILLVAFSLFELVAALSQCLYSESPYLP